MHLSGKLQAYMNLSGPSVTSSVFSSGCSAQTGQCLSWRPPGLWLPAAGPAPACRLFLTLQQHGGEFCVASVGDKRHSASFSRPYLSTFLWTYLIIHQPFISLFILNLFFMWNEQRAKCSSNIIRQSVVFWSLFFVLFVFFYFCDLLVADVEMHNG